jgi:predicted nuclease of predicted toxin-antitoxin system
MLKIVVDMNLSRKLVKLLRDAGYDCLHWQDIGLPGALDPEIFQWAKDNHRVIITRDYDFAWLLAANKESEPSVIHHRCKDASADAVFPVLNVVLQEYKQLLKQGALVIIEDDRLRVRELPFNRVL